MRVADVMTESVFTASPDLSLKKVAEQMLQYGISGLPVVDAEGCVVGVISETDILFKERLAPERDGLVDWLVHYGEDPPAAKLAARRVGEAMTSPAVTIKPRRSVAEAAALMLDLDVTRLPVVDGDRLVGIVTRTDLVRAFTRDDRELEREIREDVILKTLWSSPERVIVSAQGGQVLLEGDVDTEDAAQYLETYAARVPGVVSVDSRLTWVKGGTMLRKIIWATDGSDAAERALSTALELAESGEGNLLVVHADERFGGSRGHLLGPCRSGGDRGSPRAAGAPAHRPHRRRGRETHAEVLVVGTRGHGRIAGALLGSVAQRLLHVACPVLAVPKRTQLAGGTH
jgi:CBS domain-containing protein